MDNTRYRTRIFMRRGLTIVEILVSLAILSLLMTLMLPAVQSTREAARRMQCQSNLKQIILAANNYEATWGVTTSAEWWRQIMPYVEITEESKAISVYSCPTDPYSMFSPLAVARSYWINLGTNPGVDNPKERNGYMMISSRGNLSLITDGTSQTAAFAERLAMPPDEMYMAPTQYPQVWNRLVRRIAVDPTDGDHFADECRNRALAPLPGDWVHQGYDHQIPPNGNSCFYGVFRSGNPDPFSRAAFTASSLHSGGVYVAFADGSVRFSNNGVSIETWRALGTRAMNDVINF